MLDNLAEALLTDGIGILERSGDGTRLGEAVQSALAAPEALKRAEAEAPEDTKDTKERREMPCDESPEGTMVETGEDWIDLPDETPEAAASSLASGDRPICPRRRVPRCHARRKHRVLRRQGDGRPKDTRADREASGLHVRGAHEGRCRRYRRRTRRGAGEARASCVRDEELTDEGADRA